MTELKDPKGPSVEEPNQSPFGRAKEEGCPKAVDFTRPDGSYRPVITGRGQRDVVARASKRPRREKDEGGRPRGR